jgi:hypothetical protein
MRQFTNLEGWNKSFDQYPKDYRLEVARCNGLLISRWIATAIHLASVAISQ